MLLYHGTCIEHFLQILSDGKLKPGTKTKNNYDNPHKSFLPYVFFNAIPKTQVNAMRQISNVNGVGICFSQSILLNKIFYTNKNLSAGNTKTSLKYKIDNNTEIQKVLYRLYQHSLKIVKKIKMDTWILSGFQEVFTKIEPTFNDATHIILSSHHHEIITEINKKYPHIIIINS